MKKSLQRKIQVLALTSMLAASMLGCGGKAKAVKAEQPLIITPAPAGDEQDIIDSDVSAAVITIPNSTSDELKLYASHAAEQSYVVNAYGQKVSEYGLDVDGNIINRAGDILIGKHNVKDFSPIGRLFFKTASKTLTLTAGTTLDNAGNSVVTQFAVTSSLDLSADIINATNRIVIVSSDNPSVADVRVSNDAKVLADGAFSLGSNETALLIPDSGTVSLIITAKSAGTAVIRARCLSGSSSCTAAITVQNGETAAATNAPRDASLTNLIIPSGHTHEYTTTVVPPTLEEEGYTLYSCSCGYSYREAFAPVEPPAEVHVHSYTSHVVPPTATEQGFTVHTCECGDTYRDAYVPCLG